jgi:hypothetical protein
MTRNINVALFSAVLAAGPVAAHGVQVQATFNPATGKIETRQIAHSNGIAEPVIGFARADAITPITRVFTMPLLKSRIAGQDLWYTRPTDDRSSLGNPLWPSGPGLNFRYEYQAGAAGFGWEWGNTTTPATNPTLPNIAGTNFSYQILDGLKKWNGSSFEDAGQVQLQLHRGDGTSIPNPLVQATTTDAGPFGVLGLSAISAINRPAANTTSIPHGSVTYRLLGDGISPTVEAPNGVYLLSLQLTSTAINPTTGQSISSDPFYYVLSKGESFSQAIAASNAAAALAGVDSSQVQVLVPEPSAIGILAVAGVLLLRRRTA